jgi:hypothetical protein
LLLQPQAAHFGIDECAVERRGGKHEPDVAFVLVRTAFSEELELAQDDVFRRRDPGAGALEIVRRRCSVPTPGGRALQGTGRP